MYAIRSYYGLAEASAAGFEVNVELAEWLGAGFLRHFGDKGG